MPAMPMSNKRHDINLFHFNFTLIKSVTGKFFSELKELVEKQTEVMVTLQGKLEECRKDFESTTIELEKTKQENTKLKDDLGKQNIKFEGMFENLQKDDQDIIASITKQKVDIDNHQTALKKLMELVCDESNKNKNVTNNVANLTKNMEAKVQDINGNIQNVASLQVSSTFAQLFFCFYVKCSIVFSPKLMKLLNI